MMKDFIPKMVPMPLTGSFPFQCSACGQCCRHVKESIPLESPDMFRLARFLRDGDGRIRSTADVLAKYAEMMVLNPSGYVIYVLKTTGRDDACVFLKDNKCMVHPAKPRACRTYPVAAMPDGHGGHMVHLSVEQPCHFKGPEIPVRRWMKQYCKKEEYDFLAMDFGSAVEISSLLNKIPQAEKDNRKTRHKATDNKTAGGAAGNGAGTREAGHLTGKIMDSGQPPRERRRIT